VHAGTLGWNGFMAAGMFYWLVPRLWGTKLHSERLANLHFWVGMVGILFYVASMWVAGIGQGLSLNELTADGSAPANTFIETLKNILPMYYLRALGGGLYLLGYLLMVYNLFRTIRSGQPTRRHRPGPRPNPPRLRLDRSSPASSTPRCSSPSASS
jgi:cytochrome c oxidase cbb3-type subunit I/II